MKSLAKRILTEMALDLGGTPDWIDPQKKRRIQQRQEPLAQNPAWPQQKPPRRPGAPYRAQEPPERHDPTQHYGEVVASHVYPEIVRKVQQYTGRDPRQTNPQALMGDMMQALGAAMRIEAPHRRVLEQAAVRVVLGLPEFRDAAAAVEHGTLQIDARLVAPQEMQRAGQERPEPPPQRQQPQRQPPPQRPRARPMHVEPEDPDEPAAQEMGLGVPEIRQEYDAEAGKRRFINALIQGAAINKNYAYHEIADELRAINPQLLTLYGKAMSIAELVYWSEPEQQLNQMMGQGGPGGTEELSFRQEDEDEDEDEEDYRPRRDDDEEEEEDEDEEAAEAEPEEAPEAPEAPEEPRTITTVHARGICFPVLIQEIVKGLYEFLSLAEDEPEDIRRYTHGQVDTLGNEQWDILQGPGIWRHFNHLINQANGAEYIGRVFRHVVLLPVGEFNEFIRNVLGETPRGLQAIRQLVAEIRAEDEGQRQESKAFRIIKRIEG